MGITSRKIEVHWNYLHSIEKDLENLSRFIEFHDDNFNCYSIEISRILMASAAEIDVICRQICVDLNNTSKADNIHDYRNEILSHYKNIPKFRVIIPRYGLELIPWSNWKNRKNTVPFWWTAYNKIKHHRHTDYHRGNLKNALNAAAGLFVMTLYLYKEKAGLGELQPALKLLHVAEEHFGGSVHDGYETGLSYRI